jgi:hypothetical protein
MDKHVRILGWLYIGMSSLSILFAILAFVGMTGLGLFASISGEDLMAFPIMMIIGFVAACIAGLLAVPGLIGGMGLLNQKSWARPLVLILGLLNLFSFPIGTALGVYTCWVLISGESDAYFSGQHYHHA